MSVPCSCRRALKKADEAMKDDEALQSMTDGMSDSAEKLQPQASRPSAFLAPAQADTSLSMICRPCLSLI